MLDSSSAMRVRTAVMVRTNINNRPDVKHPISTSLFSAIIYLITGISLLISLEVLVGLVIVVWLVQVMNYS